MPEKITEFNPDRACPNCGEKDWRKDKNLTALITVEEKLLAKPIPHYDTLFIVRAYWCKNCGYVELYKVAK